MLVILPSQLFLQPLVISFASWLTNLVAVSLTSSRRAQTLFASHNRASLAAQTVKNPPAIWETWARSLDQEDPPEGGHGNPLHYSCLKNPHGQRNLTGYCP